MWWTLVCAAQIPVNAGRTHAHRDSLSRREALPRPHRPSGGHSQGPIDGGYEGSAQDSSEGQTRPLPPPSSFPAFFL